jgi:hypothetical protein
MHTAFQMHHTSRALDVCIQHSLMAGGLSMGNMTVTESAGIRSHVHTSETGFALREVGEMELVSKFGYTRRSRKQNIKICMI